MGTGAWPARGCRCRAGRSASSFRRELTSSLPRGVRGEGRAAAVAAPGREERRHRAVTYLDHNAGTPLHPEVAEFLAAAFRRDAAGNPSSVHGAGRAARSRLDAARARVARVLGRSPREVLFTASGSEACATAVLGLGRGGDDGDQRHRAPLRAARCRPARDGGGRAPARRGRSGRRSRRSRRRWPGRASPSARCRRRTTRPAWCSPRTTLARLARSARSGELRRCGAGPRAAAAGLRGGRGGLLGAQVRRAGRGGRAGGAARSRPLEPLVPGHQEGGLRGGTPSGRALRGGGAGARAGRGGPRATRRRGSLGLRDGFERALQQARPGSG